MVIITITFIYSENLINGHSKKTAKKDFFMV
jgi:hypothetical protein